LSRKGYLIPLAVLAVGVLVRVLFAFQVKDMPFYYHPVLDSGFFHQWAKFKAETTWIDHALPFREPGYAFFLAAIYRVFGDSLTAARLVQAVLGGLTALLIYRIGASLFSRAAGAIAGAIFSFFGLAVFFTGELNETTLVVFLVVLSSYLLLRARQGSAYLNCALSGALLGLAFLSRFTVIAAVPAWVIQLLVDDRPRLRAGAALLVIGFAIVPLCYTTLLLKADETSILPVRAGWQAFLGSSSTGGTSKRPYYVIKLGPEGGASSAYAQADLTDGEWDAVRFAKIEGGGLLGRRASGRYWQNRTFDDFFASPSSYLGNYFEKLGILWGASLPTPNADSRFVAGYSLLLRSMLFPFAGLAAMGLVGLFAFSRRRSSSALMFVLFYPLLACVFLVSDADKMLLTPFLAVFCGHLAATVFLGFRNMKTVRSVIYVVAVVVVAVVFSALPEVQTDEARQLMILGDIYSNESLYERAEESYGTAIEISPDFSDARLALARLYASTRETDKALVTLAEAAQRDPQNPRLRIERAMLLVYMQRPAEAIGEVAAVEHSFPYEPRLHQTKGLALMDLGRQEAAAEELELELAYGGVDVTTYTALGRARFELGQYEEAAAAFEAALRSNPAYPAPTVMQLADCYTKLERYEDAAEILARIAASDVGNVRLRFKLGNALYRAGRYNEALRNFKEISKFDPRNTDILLNMGVGYAEMDSLGQAIAAWERVLQLEPDNETARDNLRKARE
jgi:tetratricopeptide (TPR) repeat protein